MNLKKRVEILEIIRPGIHCSIQDKGRFGQRGFAIPQSGCMDVYSQRLANHLVGKAADAAVIELIGGRFECRVLKKMSLGIVGAGILVKINGLARSSNMTIQAHKNELITIEGLGLAYLATSGSMQSQCHFGSTSTYPLTKLGGLNGRLLKKGDQLFTTALESIPTKYFPEQVTPKSCNHQIIRILKGQEWSMVLTTCQDFEGLIWKISPQSNRMGIRLEGASVVAEQVEMQPVSTFLGTIQLTHRGLPIVLMNDAQTTGGYPRIGQVIRADLSRLARMILGGYIKFKFVDISEARYILNQKESFLKHALD